MPHAHCTSQKLNHRKKNKNIKTLCWMGKIYMEIKTIIIILSWNNCENVA